jgi:biotin carboxyl carrier protein
LGYGSSLIYANSVNQTPMMTVLLRKASGAGYYAMAGLPYDPVIQLSTCYTRLAVMEGKTLALGAFNTKPSEVEAMRVLAEKIEHDMDPIKAAGQMDTDEVIKLSEIRGYLECLVESCYQAQNSRRIKNPRIWSLHDLDVLAGSSLRGVLNPKQSMDPGLLRDARSDEEFRNNEQGIRAPLEGLLYLRPSPKEAPFVTEGDMLEPGQIVALIEVMKCFHPIKYEGKNKARVTKVAARDMQATRAGELIVALEV